jgi:arylsulfatase A-like enzyme
MGVANDTIVIYSSDNGPHMNTWPDGAMTWFRSEKNTNWEGPSAFRALFVGPRRSDPARSPTN